MKKIIALICVSAMLVCLCSCFRIYPVDMPEQTTVADAQQTTIQYNYSVETTAVIQTEIPTVPTTETPTETASTSPAGSTVVGTSANGYEIAVLNGITYVGGILIANKTYSLPQSYNPDGLTQECMTAFYKMVDAAKLEGIELYILSGFRSYETQDGLYSRYCASDGQDAADTYSARPGHSEHQTGLAIDVNSVSHNFAETPEGIWLAAHCTEYGFILRYPEGKNAQTGYVYEPWHIRYLGSVELAQKITASGLCLEEYLGIDSVYAQ